LDRSARCFHEKGKRTTIRVIHHLIACPSCKWSRIVSESWWRRRGNRPHQKIVMIGSTCTIHCQVMSVEGESLLCSSPPGYHSLVSCLSRLIKES
jgi:hypothetical protein